MDAIQLLTAKKLRDAEILKDLLLPTKPQKGSESTERTIAIFNQRLPDQESSTKKAPYLLNSVLNGNFGRDPGEPVENEVYIRSVFCIYGEDGEAGGMNLLNAMERIRISYQRDPLLDNMYELDYTKRIQTLCYPDDTAPYYMGEMITVWKLPPVEREVARWL